MKGRLFILTALAVLAAFPALAAGDANSATAAANIVLKKYYMFVAMGGAIGLGLAAGGGGIGQGHAVNGTVLGTARNPALSGKLLTLMMIGLAMIESLVIYMLVIVLIIFYTNPFHI
ncbi:ATP synthase subunit c family protein [Hippea jasoniae]|uniref:ATP synthase subunit C n=1 Tax=Hippea jasoniae TaxID=944479 RepID=UPI000558EE72|nr:ATP synthase subunit C [Hippea jasoniae]